MQEIRKVIGEIPILASEQVGLFDKDIDSADD
jgi:coatomer subunit beta